MARSSSPVSSGSTTATALPSATGAPKASPACARRRLALDDQAGRRPRTIDLGAGIAAACSWPAASTARSTSVMANCTSPTAATRSSRASIPPPARRPGSGAARAGPAIGTRSRGSPSTRTATSSRGLVQARGRSWPGILAKPALGRRLRGEALGHERQARRARSSPTAARGASTPRWRCRMATRSAWPTKFRAATRSASRKHGGGYGARAVLVDGGAALVRRSGGHALLNSKTRSRRQGRRVDYRQGARPRDARQVHDRRRRARTRLAVRDVRRRQGRAPGRPRVPGCERARELQPSRGDRRWRCRVRRELGAANVRQDHAPELQGAQWQRRARRVRAPARRARRAVDVQHLSRHRARSPRRSRRTAAGSSSRGSLLPSPAFGARGRRSPCIAGTATDR